MSRRPGVLIISTTLLLVHLAFLAATYHANEIKFFIFVAGTLALAGYLAAQVLLRGRRLRGAFVLRVQKHVLVAVLAMLVIAAASIAWTSFRVAAAYRTFELLLAVAWAVMVVVVVRSRRDLSWFLMLFVVIGALTAGVACLTNADEAQYTFPIGNPNWLACCLLIPMMLCIEGICRGVFGNPRRLASAGLCALALAVMTPVLLLAQSESAEASFVLALAALPVLARVKRKWMLSGAVVGVIVLAIALDLTLGNPGKLRAFARSKSVAIRLDMWRWGLKLAARNPVSGLGAGGYLPNVGEVSAPDMDRNPGFHNPISVHAHNEPMEVLVELGVLGLAAFLFPVVALLVAVTRLPRDGPDDALRTRTAALAAGWLAVFLQSLLTVGMRFWSVPVVFWTALGLLVASTRLLAKGAPLEEETPVASQADRRGSAVTLFVLIVAALLVVSWFVVFRGMRASLAMKRAMDEPVVMKRVNLLRTASRDSAFFVDRVRATKALGETCLRQRAYEAANDQFEIVFNLAGQYHDTELLLITTYLNRNPRRVDAAMRHIEHASRLRPARPEPATMLAAFLRKLPETERPAEIARLGEMYPQLSKLRVAVALVADDDARVRTLLDEAIALNDDDAHARFLRALLWWKRGDIDRAREEIERCREMGFRIHVQKLATYPKRWTSGFPKQDDLTAIVRTLAPPQ